MENLITKIGKVVAGVSLLAALGTGCASTNLNIPKDKSIDGKYHLFIPSEAHVENKFGKIDKRSRDFVRKSIEERTKNGGIKYYEGNIGGEEIRYRNNLGYHELEIYKQNGTKITFLDDESEKGDTIYYHLPDGKIDRVLITKKS